MLERGRVMPESLKTFIDLTGMACGGDGRALLPIQSVSTGVIVGQAFGRCKN